MLRKLPEVTTRVYSYTTPARGGFEQGPDKEGGNAPGRHFSGGRYFW